MPQNPRVFCVTLNLGSYRNQVLGDVNTRRTTICQHAFTDNPGFFTSIGMQYFHTPNDSDGFASLDFNQAYTHVIRDVPLYKFKGSANRKSYRNDLF